MGPEHEWSWQAKAPAPLGPQIPVVGYFETAAEEYSAALRLLSEAFSLRMSIRESCQARHWCKMFKAAAVLLQCPTDAQAV
jgi:hypothetical protein